jgi:hypothetical protein
MRDDCVSASDVDDTRTALAATARRFPGMTRRDLFQVANDRVESLTWQVCEISDHLRNQIRTDENSRKGRTGLVKVTGLVATVALAISGYSPSVAVQNLSAWEKTAAEVITLYQIAERAQPDQPVAPLLLPRIP